MLNNDFNFTLEEKKLLYKYYDNLHKIACNKYLTNEDFIYKAINTLPNYKKGIIHRDILITRILYGRKISEEFIRKLINDGDDDDVFWQCITINQNLSEEFMREYKDKIAWEHVLENQRVSDEFKIEFKDKLK